MSPRLHLHQVSDHGDGKARDHYRMLILARWLGFIHACYGLGCLVAPFVATSIANATSGRSPPSFVDGGKGWLLYYCFPLALSLVNVSAVAWAFWDELSLSCCKPRRQEVGAETRREGVVHEMGQMAKMKNIWLISLFFFFHLGVGSTAGGQSSPVYISCLSITRTLLFPCPLSEKALLTLPDNNKKEHH